jgi:hypothetical protein
MIETVHQPDPNWRRYFVWPPDYFPFNFPSGRVERTQREIGGTGARITLRMSSGVPFIFRIDDERGHILHEVLPREGDGSYFEVTSVLGGELLGQTIGLAFSWGYYVPLVDYVKRYPLGVVKVAGSDLRGRETIVTITDTRPPERKPARSGA